MLFNFSVAADDGDFDERGSCGASLACKFGVGGPSNVEEGSFGVGAMPAPGCLKMPNCIDFL